MKRILPYLFVVLFLQIAFTASATDYYSTKSGDPSDLGTWNSSRTGNGIAPTGFNDPNDNFIIQPGTVISGVKFSCKGSLIIETGGTYTTGSSGNTSNIASVITINEGGVLKLSPKTILVTGFILIQGSLENLGGELRFNTSQTSSPVATTSKKSSF